MSTIFDFFDPRSTTSPFLQKSFPNLRLNKSTEKFWQIPKSPKSLSKLYISRVLSKVKPSTPSIARFFHKERGGRKRVDERHGEKRGLYTLGSCLRYERPLSGRGLEARKRFTVAVRPPRGFYSTPIESRSSLSRRLLNEGEEESTVPATRSLHYHISDAICSTGINAHQYFLPPLPWPEITG